MVEMPEVWKAGIDPEAFGRKVREQDNGYFTDKGMSSYPGMNGSGKTYGETGQGGQTLRQGFLKQAKKECAAREVLPPKADKHGPEL